MACPSAPCTWATLPLRGPQTGRLLAERLGLREDRYRITFQSRFGKAKWLEPYTQPTIEALAQAGTRPCRCDVPGFTSDCLETLEEINMEVREAFLHAGGKSFTTSPAWNDNHHWITALSRMAQQHLAGWPTDRGRG